MPKQAGRVSLLQGVFLGAGYRSPDGVGPVGGQLAGTDFICWKVSDQILTAALIRLAGAFDRSEFFSLTMWDRALADAETRTKKFRPRTT